MRNFDATKCRLSRILRRCGWTIHVQHRKYGSYARAVKRDEAGKQHWKYIGSLNTVAALDTAQIVAVLPPVA